MKKLLLVIATIACLFSCSGKDEIVGTWTFNDDVRSYTLQVMEPEDGEKNKGAAILTLNDGSGKKYYATWRAFDYYDFSLSDYDLKVALNHTVRGVYLEFAIDKNLEYFYISSTACKAKNPEQRAKLRRVK
ncbi:MAG: hypothetical protein MJZ32_10260 [Bacteroidaceae bacterium]|nr:hypothetical protein [Bacteroidaceae bacterium]